MRDSPEHHTGRSSPPILNKKTGIEYWENFPLDTPENIRRWQGDCAMHSQFRDELTTTSQRGSRTGSVDLQRDSQPSLPRTSSIPQQPFRSDSYPRSNHHTPTSQPGYMSPQLPSSQNQQWANGNGAFMQTGYGGTQDQSWQQQQQSGAFGNHHPHNHHHSASQQGSSMQMDVDTGFFPSDMKRNLFW
jgi:hypothetical protein